MMPPEVGVAFIRHHRVETAEPVVGFEFEGWTRYLTVRGQRWFEIGGGCDTCLFFFERIQSERLSPVELADRLRSGQKLFDPSLLATVDQLLPPATTRCSRASSSPSSPAPTCQTITSATSRSICLASTPSQECRTDRGRPTGGLVRRPCRPMPALGLAVMGRGLGRRIPSCSSIS